MEVKILVLIILGAVFIRFGSFDSVSFAFDPKLILSDHSNDSVRIRPDPEADTTSGFAICFRFMFHFWSVSEIVHSNSVVIGFGNFTWPSGFFKIGRRWYISDWPESIVKSPYVWYSACLSYNASAFEVVLALNGVTMFNISDRAHLEHTTLVSFGDSVQVNHHLHSYGN